MTELLAWHGNAALKQAIVARMVGHRKADRLVKGIYWEDGKGCAVGCLIHSGDHSQYEPLFGIPQTLARLEDTVFENLPNGDAMKWPERFLKAANPGADLSLVQWQFLEFILEEALARPEAATIRTACRPALNLVRSKACGGPVSEAVARAAWSAASAAKSAAKSAAESAAQSAAAAAWAVVENGSWSAVESVETAAESAAWSAAESAASAAWSAAESAAWNRYADKLIELMEAAPPARSRRSQGAAHPVATFNALHDPAQAAQASSRAIGNTDRMPLDAVFASADGSFAELRKMR